MTVYLVYFAHLDEYEVLDICSTYEVAKRVQDEFCDKWDDLYSKYVYIRPYEVRES